MIIENQEAASYIMDAVNDDQLMDMLTDLLILKKQEEEIKELRVNAENDIAAIISTKEEGTDKKTLGIYKVTVTSKLTRTLDYPAYLAVATSIPIHLRPIVEKPDINLKKLRTLDVAMPGVSVGFITTKPAKSAVKVEVIG